MSSENTQVFEVDALHRRLFDWHDREVVVAGYPMLNMSRGFLKGDVRLHVDPEKSISDTPLVVATIDPSVGMERVMRGDVVVLRGKVRATIEGHLALDGCTPVASSGGGGSTLPEAAPELTPEVASSGTPVRVDQLVEAARGLLGETIEVRGWYNGWTTSDTGSRVIHRIDLHDASSGKEGVSCELKAEPPEGLGRPGRLHIVRGRLSGKFTENVLLTDAEIIASDV